MIETNESGAILLLDVESERLLSSITETITKSLRQLVRIGSWFFICLFAMLAVASSLSARRYDYTICAAPMGFNVEVLSTDCVHPPMHYDVLACALALFAITGILVSMILGRIALHRLRITIPAD